MRKKRKYIPASGSEAKFPGILGGKNDLRVMDVLILTHQYDSLCLYLTAPIIFQTQERHPEYSSIILGFMEEKIREYSLTDVTGSSNLVMDCTNRYAWGKVYVEINRLVNFPY